MQINKQPWYRRIGQILNREGRWLRPGLGVKRWLLVILAGTTLIGLGFAVLLIDVYRTAPESWWLPILSFLSLRFLARPLRALIFGGLGLALIFTGIWGLNKTLLRPFMRPGSRLVDAVSEYRKRDRGPRVVVIGGGTGLAALLRGLKGSTHNLTAIVTVADDGGSSGELRRSLGVLPPGDIRNCLAALSDDEELITQLFQYRFAGGTGNLGGHTLGNLLITAMADITGSFPEGVAEMGKVLTVRGTVMPATLHDVRLVADVIVPDSQREMRVKGESEIPKAAGRIKRVWLEPNNPLAYPPAIQSILAADVIVIGPGSLFTSILPNLLVSDLTAAIRSSRALKMYVCNVATQPGETDGFNCGDHVRTLEKHVGEHLFDLVISNNQCNGKLPNGVSWVCLDAATEADYSTYQADLLDEERPWRHDSNKLAHVIIDLYYERTGPLINRNEE